jgi:hypothetical protein
MPDTPGKRQRREVKARKRQAKDERRGARTERRNDPTLGPIDWGDPDDPSRTPTDVDEGSDPDTDEPGEAVEPSREP